MRGVSCEETLPSISCEESLTRSLSQGVSLEETLAISLSRGPSHEESLATQGVSHEESLARRVKTKMVLFGSKFWVYRTVRTLTIAVLGTIAAKVKVVLDLQCVWIPTTCLDPGQ